MLDPDEEHGNVEGEEEGQGGGQAEDEKTASRQSHKNRRRCEKVTNVSLLCHEDEGIVRARPRKRQKFGSRDPSPSSPSHAAATDSSDHSPVPSSLASVSSSAGPPLEFPGRHTPTPPPSSLPFFPLPSRPDAPERSELASQGLDRALARAQLVDPLLSTPLSFDEDDNAHTGLSVRMRRRLRDLGITELFAGG